MAVFWLDDYSPYFPDPTWAYKAGLVAIGGSLSPERLWNAYINGIFPWYQSPTGDFYWYSPDPRCVLFPSDLIVHKSMRSIFNQNKFTYTLDTAFETVMRNCAQSRRKLQQGSWIDDDFVEGYSEMHRFGFAHSVEVWEGEELVGGLYGISIGNVFFGESMFAKKANASKAGFITLVRALEKSGFVMIDCQQRTHHLMSLGATTIPRIEFLNQLKRSIHYNTLRGKWYLTDDGLIGVSEEGMTAAQV